MCRWLGWLLTIIVGATGLVIARDARADDEPAPVIVVEVAKAASENDPDALRTQIGAELHAEVVKPGDPRAAAAKEDRNGKAGDLSVSGVRRQPRGRPAAVALRLRQPFEPGAGAGARSRGYCSRRRLAVALPRRAGAVRRGRTGAGLHRRGRIPRRPSSPARRRDRSSRARSSRRRSTSRSPRSATSGSTTSPSSSAWE